MLLSRRFVISVIVRNVLGFILGSCKRRVSGCLFVPQFTALFRCYVYYVCHFVELNA